MTSSTEISSSALNLAGTLGAQCKAAAVLARTLRRKQRILVEHRLSELAPCAELEQVQANHLAQLEGRRASQTEDLAAALAGQGGLPDGMPLRDMLVFMPETAETAELRSAADGLQVALSELQELNRDNSLLLQLQLDYTSLVLRLLAQGGQPPGYSARGQLSTPPHGAGLALVDNQV